MMKTMLPRLLSVLTVFVSSASLPAAEELFTLTPIVDGVYAAIAKPAYKVNCNAVVIILDKSVLVVDTHSKPSAARALIDQIKAITPKPVKYVVNTHFHWDHAQGNQAYPSAWPAGIEILSSEATRQNLLQRGIPRVQRQLIDAPKEIYKLNADLAKATDPKEKATLADNLRQAEAYLAELKSLQVVLPTRTFDRSMTLHDPARTVELLWLGNAHTDGDVWVYLPKEKIIVCGDAMHGWVPFMGDSYPYDWIKTLATVEKLDFDYVVGGHGGVMRGKAQFKLWQEYFGDLMTETAQHYARGGTMNEALVQVMQTLQSKYGNRFIEFSTRAQGNVEKAFRVVSGATN